MICFNSKTAPKASPATKVPTVPETILKKRKQRALQKAKALGKAIKDRKIRKVKRQTIFKRAEQYVKEYRQKERDLIRIKRQAKQHGNFYVPEEPKLAFVIRIRGYSPLKLI